MKGLVMAKTATRGILGFVLAVLLVVGSLWLVPGSAHASVGILPPPVEPSPTLPSQYVRAVSSAGFGPEQVDYVKWANQQLAARGSTGLTAQAVAEASPLTKLSPLARGAAGVSLAGAFAAGWLITDGTLAMWAHTTGSPNALSGSCQWGGFASAAVDILYPISGPTCDVPIAGPNSDIAAGWSVASYAGLTVQNQGDVTIGSLHIQCYQVTVPAGGFPAQTTIAVAGLANGQNLTGINLGSGASSWCAPVGGGYHFLNYASNYAGTGFPAVSIYSTTAGGSVTGVRSTTTLAASDPYRKPRCDLKWPDGTTTTAIATDAQRYKESAGLPLAMFSALCNDSFVSKPGHGPSLLPSEIKIGSTDEGGAYTELQKEAVPDFTPDERKGLTAPAGGGLILQKIVGNLTSSCMNWDADCSGWWPATSNGTTTQTSTGTYRCTFGGSTVALSECGIYRYTFDTRTSTPTITDPTTGAETPWVSGTPVAPPYTGGVTEPNPADSCYSSWPSAPDPITWVQYPIRCELVRAFVPRTSVVTATQTAMSTAWANTWPVQGMTAVTAVFAAVPSAGGCAGPRVQFSLTWPAPIDFDAQPLNACNPPISILAWFANVIGAVSIMFATAWGITRRIGAIVNAKGVGPS
jgi:hypothetical protein